MAPHTENLEGMSYVLELATPMLELVGSEVRFGAKSLKEMALDVPEVLKMCSKGQKPGNEAMTIEKYRVAIAALCDLRKEILTSERFTIQQKLFLESLPAEDAPAVNNFAVVPIVQPIHIPMVDSVESDVTTPAPVEPMFVLPPFCWPALANFIGWLFGPLFDILVLCKGPAKFCKSIIPCFMSAALALLLMRAVQNVKNNPAMVVDICAKLLSLIPDYLVFAATQISIRILERLADLFPPLHWVLCLLNVSSEGGAVSGSDTTDAWGSGSIILLLSLIFCKHNRPNPARP